MLLAELFPPLSYRRWCVTASTPTCLPRRWCPSSLRRNRAVQQFVGSARRCRNLHMKGTFCLFVSRISLWHALFSGVSGIKLIKWLQLTVQGHKSKMAELCGWLCWIKPGIHSCLEDWLLGFHHQHSKLVLTTGAAWIMRNRSIYFFMIGDW